MRNGDFRSWGRECLQVATKVHHHRWRGNHTMEDVRRFAWQHVEVRVATLQTSPMALEAYELVAEGLAGGAWAILLSWQHAEARKYWPPSAASTVTHAET